MDFNICVSLIIQHFLWVNLQIHVLPREILGISTFGLSVFLLKWFPINWVDALLLIFSRLILGNIEKYGLRRPKIGPLQIKCSTGKTPVLDIGALKKIKNGEIKVNYTTHYIQIPPPPLPPNDHASSTNNIIH